jgi:hypothetical protein
LGIEEEEMPLSRQEEMEDRQEYLENQKRLKGSTFMAHTHDDTGGRFRTISNPTIIGSEKIPKYPAAFLNHDPVPTEPPLGVSINEHPPTGEPHELRASVSTPGPLAVSPVQATSDLSSDAPPSNVPPIVDGVECDGRSDFSSGDLPKPSIKHRTPRGRIGIGGSPTTYRRA